MNMNGLNVFLMVAEERSFRAASDRLGISRPAVSQTIRQLEQELGTALLRRTTRSVSLTEEGERLFAGLSPALAGVRAAVASVAEHDAIPRGQVRLAISSIAEDVLSGRWLAEFVRRCPEVQLDITVTDEEFDIVAEGYDAGVRLGEVIAQDMIAIPVSAPQRQLAVCAPSYLARAGAPVHPRDLAAHRCIGWRPSPRSAPYRWEFAEGGREFSVAVEPGITTNDMGLMIRLACAGGGITFGMEECFRAPLERGDLVPLLEEFSPRFPGFFLYYPSRRDMPARLRALLECVRTARRPTT